jgi:tetratricopeptide (TPR) repeat protein
VEALHRADDLARAGDVVAALPPVERCAGIDPAAIGPVAPEDAESLAAIARVRDLVALTSALGKAGQHAQALATGEQALVEASELGWAPLVAEALEAVGAVESARGDYPAAEARLRDAYFEALEGGHDAIAVHAASQLVFVVGYRLARRADGLQWARHAEARLGTPSITGLDEARLRNSMGAMFEDQGRFDDAAAVYQRALELLEVERGVDHPDVATVHNNLGNLAERRGDFATAEAEHRRALAVREQALGESHEMTAMSFNNLGIALHRQGRSREAEPFLRRALDVRVRVLGKSHPLVARTHMNLGVTLKALDRLDEAEAHMRSAIAILEATLGDRHADLAGALLNLGNILRRARRIDEALAAVARARTIYESTLPAEHPSIARVLATESELRDVAAGKLAK